MSQWSCNREPAVYSHEHKSFAWFRVQQHTNASRTKLKSEKYQHTSLSFCFLSMGLTKALIRLLRSKFFKVSIIRLTKDEAFLQVVDVGFLISSVDASHCMGFSTYKAEFWSNFYFCCRKSGLQNKGYSWLYPKIKIETVLDWRDYFDHHTLPLSRRNPNRWPEFPADYRELVATYSDEMKILAQKLLALISESLGLRASCIEDAVGEFYQNITISYYPPCPEPDLTLGLQSHSDMGAITLLIQDDVGGLQVLKGGNKWVTVQPLSDAILVLLADQTEIITNGKYRSCEHRAITNPDRARLSVATFHDPAKTVKISPASELINDSSLAKYRDVVYGDYVSSWYTKGPGGKRNIDALLLDP
ncbi:hypothetical protein JHK87_049051 [Glycine soja]|nr:hypothetical protein JHK87_049051 [Glycine soja]